MAYAGDTALPDVGRFSDDPCRVLSLPEPAPRPHAGFPRPRFLPDHRPPGAPQPLQPRSGESTAYARAMDTNGEEREFGSWLLWPNFALEVYSGGYLNVFHHEPTTPERTVQRVEWYFPTEEPTPE